MTNQPSPAPTSKVTVGLAAGAFATVVAWGLSSVGVEVPAEVATSFATVLAFGAAYVVPEP